MPLKEAGEVGVLPQPQGRISSLNHAKTISCRSKADEVGQAVCTSSALHHPVLLGSCLGVHGSSSGVGTVLWWSLCADCGDRLGCMGGVIRRLSYLLYLKCHLLSKCPQLSLLQQKLSGLSRSEFTRWLLWCGWVMPGCEGKLALTCLWCMMLVESLWAG